MVRPVAFEVDRAVRTNADLSLIRPLGVDELALAVEEGIRVEAQGGAVAERDRGAERVREKEREEGQSDMSRR